MQCSVKWFGILMILHRALMTKTCHGKEGYVRKQTEYVDLNTMDRHIIFKKSQNYRIVLIEKDI